MSSLGRRLAALEEKAIVDLPPLPALVRFADTPEQHHAALQELKTRPRGTQVVLLHTIDCRKPSGAITSPWGDMQERNEHEQDIEQGSTNSLFQRAGKRLP